MGQNEVAEYPVAAMSFWLLVATAALIAAIIIKERFMK